MSDWKPFMRGFNQGPSLAEILMWGISRRDARHEKIAEDEAQATADEEAKKREAELADLMVSMFLPEPTGFEQGAQLGTTYPDLGLSTQPGAPVPGYGKRHGVEPQQQTPQGSADRIGPAGWMPGIGPPQGEDIYAQGAPTYAEGEGAPTQKLLAIMKALEAGTIDPGMAFNMMNMAGGKTELYEQAPEEVPVEFDQQSFDLVATMFANSFPHIPTKEDFPEEFHDEVDMVGRMPMQTIMDLYKKPEEEVDPAYASLFNTAGGVLGVTREGEADMLWNAPPSQERPQAPQRRYEETWTDEAGRRWGLPYNGGDAELIPGYLPPILSLEADSVLQIPEDKYNEIGEFLGANVRRDMNDNVVSLEPPRGLTATQFNNEILDEYNKRIAEGNEEVDSGAGYTMPPTRQAEIMSSFEQEYGPLDMISKETYLAGLDILRTGTVITDQEYEYLKAQAEQLTFNG